MLRTVLLGWFILRATVLRCLEKNPVDSPSWRSAVVEDRSGQRCACRCKDRREGREVAGPFPVSGAQ